MGIRALALRIASLQYEFVWKMNDIHIFTSQAMPVLEQARREYAESDREGDRHYYVPSVGRGKVAKRKDQELKELYDSFLRTELHRTFLVSAVSQFEAFLGQVLALVFREYPRKLTTGVPGVPACKDVPATLLLDSGTIEEAVERVIERHLAGVFYAAPKAYLEYVGKVTGIETDDPAFASYLEIKATRDLITHNAGVINEVYLAKAGDRARGKLGDAVVIDKAYFEQALAILKRLSGIIKRDTTKAFPVKAKGVGDGNTPSDSRASASQ
jgi:hypothetical protein